MPRRIFQAPLDSVDAAERALRDLAALYRMRIESDDYAALQPEPVQTGPVPAIVEGLKIYAMSLDDILQYREASAARYVGWLFVTMNEAGVAGTEVHLEPVHGTHVFAQFNTGDRPQSLIDSVARLDAEIRDNKEYEVAMLRIPALHFESLWLRAEQDRILPFDPAVPPLVPGQVYEAGQLLMELARQVGDNTQFDNSPAGAVQAW